MITREQAGALAALARTLRPGWDELATRNAIGEVRDRDLADVAYAVIRTAEDAAMRTPAAVAFVSSSHWRPTLRESETPEERTARLQIQADAATEARSCPLCDDHGWLASGFRCPHDGLTADQRAQRASERAAAARAAIRPTVIHETSSSGGTR